MRGMEEIIDKNKFDKTYIQVDTETRIKVKDQESQQYKEDIELLEAFLGESFKKIKTLKFEKRYLEIDNKSANEILTKIETDVRPYLSMRDT
jgi:predicted secreted protein